MVMGNVCVAESVDEQEGVPVVVDDRVCVGTTVCVDVRVNVCVDDCVGITVDVIVVV
jgi:Pyruvate/2-oxoacid:ferredoxin oxidoreductase delta subunit